MELNGLSLIQMWAVDLYASKTVTKEQFAEFNKRMDLFERYLLAWEEQKGIDWSEVRDNPGLYPNMAEWVENLKKTFNKR